MGPTKAKAQLAFMPCGGTRSGCGPTTSTDVYATREQLRLATRASAIVMTLSNSSAGSVSTSRAASRVTSAWRSAASAATLAASDVASATSSARLLHRLSVEHRLRPGGVDSGCS